MTSPHIDPRISLTRARYVYLVLGWIFLGLGFAGVFLPLLPTTPMLVVAAWAFSRSSARIHNWIYTHSVFGPLLERWDRHRVIPIHAKFLAVSAMAASFIYLSVFSEVPSMAVVGAGTFLACASWYVASRPSRIPQTENSEPVRLGS